MNCINIYLIAIFVLFKYGTSKEQKEDPLIKSIMITVSILWFGWMTALLLCFPQYSFLFDIINTYFVKI